jgi:hypothetical protein
MRALLPTLPILSLSMASMLPLARADPPPLGQAVNFLEPMVVCKTHRELKELVDALRISVEVYDAKLRELAVDQSECDVNTVSGVRLAECEDVGMINFNNSQRRVWIVHFASATKEGWGLYEEPVAAQV